MTDSLWKISWCWLVSISVAVAAEANMQLQDRALIGEILAQYAYRWDGKDSAGFADLFTSDGAMERWVSGARVDGSVVEGRTSIFDYARGAHLGRLADRQTRHHFSALVFKELTETSAVTENMALITHQTAGSAPAIASSGIYRITWRKTNLGWRMVKRVLFTDRFDP